MSMSTPIDKLMNQFRLASRELFNHFFRVPDPYNSDTAWVLKGRFDGVQALLFEKLVTEPGSLPAVKYGDPQSGVLVELRTGETAPIMVNREVDSGYWDFPLKDVTKAARLVFICFFDWDQLHLRDNRYVRVRIESWQSNSAVVGKDGLI